MATETVSESGQESDIAASEQTAGGDFMKKMIIVGALLLVVMGVQFFLFWYFLSGNDSGSNNADNIAIEDSPVIGDPQNPGGGSSTEVEIDDFNCTNGTAAEGQSVHVTFKLVALVASGSSESFSQSAKKDHKYRVLSAVDKIIRSSTLEDLRDPNHDVIKRRIKEDINKILGNSSINEVIIANFKMMEQ